MDFIALAHRTNLGMYRGLLLHEHPSALKIANLRQHRALHQSTALVVFDVSHPLGLVECDLLCKSLLLKISNRVIVRVGEEVHDIARCLHIVFQVIHEMRTVAFDLLIAANRAKDNFRKLSTLEWAVRDSSDYFTWQIGRLGEAASRVMRQLHILRGILELHLEKGDDTNGAKGRGGAPEEIRVVRL